MTKELNPKFSSSGASIGEEAFNIVVGLDATQWKDLFANHPQIISWEKVRTAIPVILSGSTMVVYYSDRRTRPQFQKFCVEHPAWIALVGCAVLNLLAVGQLVLSPPVPGGGKRFWSF